MINFIAVGVGGFIGACLRYAVSRLLSRFAFFPFGTLVSNLIAAFIIGFIIGAERQTALLPERVKLLLSTGMLGGLSTFSAFSLETVTLIERNSYLQAAGNIFLNVGFSIIFVFTGLAAAKIFIKG